VSEPPSQPDDSPAEARPAEARPAEAARVAGGSSEVPDTPSSGTAGSTPSGDPSHDLTPYLLVMPPTDGPVPTVAWPGRDGEPAWAIPVTPPADGPVPTVAWPGRDGEPAWAIPVRVPPGTRGYALFLPVAQPTEPGVTPAGTRTSTPAAATPPADTAADTPATAATPPATPTPPAASTPPAAAAAATTSPTPTPAAPDGGTRPDGSPGRPATPSQVGPGLAPAPPPFAFTSVPRPPSLLKSWWPGPPVGQGWAVPASVLAGALGLAFFVPLSRTGIGWLLGWLVLTVGVVVAVRRAAANLPRAERWVRGGWAAAALALLSVLAFRNAWWLVTLCVFGALGCTTLAIVGGRLIRSILFGLVAAPFAALRGLPWVRKHLRTGSGERRTGWRVTRAVAATAAVLLVFGALLSSADAAFSVILDEVVPEIGVGTVFRWIFLSVVGGLIAVAAVYTISAPPDLSTVDRPAKRRFGVLEWVPPIAGLTLLFGGFVAVQFTVLFGGQRHVLRTAGLSYAEYARSGFWQLLAVTLLTLALLGGVTRWARRERPVERILLRVFLGLLSALALVIVASALSRMYTYQKVYSFTGERVFVMAFELLLGVVFLLILVAGIRWRGAWIPRATVGLAVVMLLGLAVLNPEDYVARRNIARYQETGKIDAWYLRALSADATPALATLPDPVRRCTLSWIADDLDEPDPWYAWNLGRARARDVLDRLGPEAIGGRKDCHAADQFDLPKTRSHPR